ncbi:MAG TPA: hypothetical protein VMD99_11170 [Terriglobales bacterium]|nr:hypothetical protein [Terriglobales bacterium]
MTSLFNNTYDNTAIPAAEPVEASPVSNSSSKKNGWLPLLTVLFLISYGLMTMLIIEQGRTIESQRVLIRELFRDSTELSAVKAQWARNAAEGHSPSAAKTPALHIPSTQAPVTHIPSTQVPSTQIPSTQIPSTQVQTKQTPSSQAATQRQSQNKKPQFQMPSRPASDVMDENRSLITI